MMRKKTIIASLTMAMILSVSLIPGEAFAASNTVTNTSTKPAVTKEVDTSKKAPANQVVTKKAPANQVVAKKAPANQVAVKKASVNKPVVNKSVPKKTTTK